MDTTMIDFAKTNRTTDYFRDYAIAQIRIAYRVMEYLAPDDIFPPKNLDSHTKELILTQNFVEAYDRIYEDEIMIDCSSSMGSEALRSQGVALMEYLLPLYIRNCKDVKEARRLELLKELKELEAK